MTMYKAEVSVDINPPRRVLPFGTRVVLVKVDMHGLLGRDLHPRQEDVGFTGVIIENSVDDCEGNHQENVRPFKNLTDEESCIYLVISPLGAKLEISDDELEVLPG